MILTTVGKVSGQADPFLQEISQPFSIDEVIELENMQEPQKWSWIEEDDEPATQTWQEALAKVEAFTKKSGQKRERPLLLTQLKVHQTVLDGNPPPNIDLTARAEMGRLLLIIHYLDKRKIKDDNEPLRWYVDVNNRHQWRQNHVDVMNAKLALGRLLFSKHGETSRNMLTRLYLDILSIDANDFVFDDENKQRLNLDVINAANGNADTKQIGQVYRQSLLKERWQEINRFRLTVTRKLLAMQYEADSPELKLKRTRKIATLFKRDPVVTTEIERQANKLEKQLRDANQREQQKQNAQPGMMY